MNNKVKESDKSSTAPKMFSQYEYKENEIGAKQSSPSMRPSGTFRSSKSKLGRRVSVVQTEKDLNWKKVSEHSEVTCFRKCGQIDQIKTQMNEDMMSVLQNGEEIAIIGFWEKVKGKDNSSHTLKCKNYCFVPKPCKRLVCKG